MPELPEVETIRLGLMGQCENIEIVDVESHSCRVFQVARDWFRQVLLGDRIQRLDRLGKFLIFRLSEHDLVIHLGMTGQLTLRDTSRSDSPHFFRHPTTGFQRVRQHSPL